MDADTPSRVTRTEQGRDDGAIFGSNFPPTTTQEDLSEAERKYEQFVVRLSFALLSLKQVGFLSGFIIIGLGNTCISYIRTRIMSRCSPTSSYHRPGGGPSASNVQRIHTACPLVLWGDVLKIRKPLDPATSSAILKELTRTVSRFGGSHNPSRVL
jgi:hypothetical protein